MLQAANDWAVRRKARQLSAYVLGIALALVVPPRVDLGSYNPIGLIELSSNAKGNLQQFATQKLVETVQSAQPGTRILELGKREPILRAIEHDELDFEAIRTIGERYQVDSVLVGGLEVTDVKPKVRVSTFLTSMSARAEVAATMSVRLVETASGATVWSSSARGQESVAHVSIVSRGPADFGASDPESAYGRLVQTLVHQVTRDFRARYEKH
jgi:hypothetical protein